MHLLCKGHGKPAGNKSSEDSVYYVKNDIIKHDISVVPVCVVVCVY